MENGEVVKTAFHAKLKLRNSSPCINSSTFRLVCYFTHLDISINNLAAVATVKMLQLSDDRYSSKWQHLRTIVNICRGGEKVVCLRRNSTYYIKAKRCFLFGFGLKYFS